MLHLLDNDPVIPSNCLENSLVLFVRFLGSVGPFWLLISPFTTRILSGPVL